MVKHSFSRFANGGKRRLGAASTALGVALSLATGTAWAANGQVAIQDAYQSGLAQKTQWVTYTEEAYWASPVLVDLEGDGSLEVIIASYSLAVLNANTGQEKWRVNAGKDRSTPYDIHGNVAKQVFCDIEVTDLDGDGRNEIVVGYGNGSVSVLDDQGYFKPGWPQQVTSSEGFSIRSLAVGDLEGDGQQEIVVGAGIPSPESVWVYRCDGSVAPGWPQLSLEKAYQLVDYAPYKRAMTGYSAGLYADGLALGDLDGDGTLEIIVPTDTPHISAYHYDGSPVKAGEEFEGRFWGQIALYQDDDDEKSTTNNLGWGGDPMRSALGNCAAIFSDVDADGSSEVIVTSTIVDFTNFDSNGGSMVIDDARYMTAFVFNRDRTRYVNPAYGFDWTAAPQDLGGCLKSVDPVSVVGGILSEPVCSDVDGDGFQEILFNSFNGKLHCFSLDGTEHGAWPFTLPKTTADVFEFATPPACADLNGDGKQEVIFASWTGKNGNDPMACTGVVGALYVLDWNGNLLASKDLPAGYEAALTNGVKAAPTVQDVDGDGKMEVFLNTLYYALCVYRLDASQLPWDNTDTTRTPAQIAYTSTQSVDINGTPVTFEMYALKDKDGNPTNYVKERDVAWALKGTSAEFNVGWDGSLHFFPGQTYISDGSEMKTAYSGDRPYTIASYPTYVNDDAVELDSFVLHDENGGGYPYYKLRDLGRVLGFLVDWSPERGIYIETDPS